MTEKVIIKSKMKNKTGVTSGKIISKDTRKSKSVCRLFLYTIGRFIGVSCILISIFVMYHLWATDSFERLVLKNLRIYRDSEIFELWKEPDVYSLVYVYPFNYTNADQVLENGGKVQLQEVGPYVFKEISMKAHVEFEGEDMVTYTENRTHVFIPELSNGDLDDILITPNVPVIAAIAQTRTGSFVDNLVIKMLLNGLTSNGFVPITVNDYIFGSNGDAFSAVTRNLARTFKNKKTPKLGVLSGRTGLKEDRITIATGMSNLDELGVIKKFNGQEQLDVWQDECNSITGSEGNMFPGRVVAYSDRIHIYAKDLCRRIPLDFQKEFVTKEGFPVRRYALPPNVFSSADINPENACFCQEDCPPSGTFSLSPCNMGAPVVLSYPHFLYGSPSLFDNIEGLRPDPEKHSFYLDIHSSLGLPLAGDSRFQVGIELKRAPFHHPLNNIEEGTVLPLVWMNIQVGKLGPNSMEKLNKATFESANIKLLFGIISILVCMISLAGTLFLCCCCCKKKNVKQVL